MKRLTSKLLVFLFPLAFALPSFSQEVAAHSDKSALTFEAGDAEGTTAVAPALLAHPDAKLTNALARTFPMSAQAQWWQQGDGFYVQFFNGESKARAVFNKKGVLQYAITDCNATQLPDAFRQKMAQQYAGYTLLHAVTIKAHNAIAHQVVLHNEKEYITLKATGGEIEELEKKTKY